MEFESASLGDIIFVIIKGRRESLIQINLGKMKIMKERELGMEKNVGNVRKRGISGRSVREDRKTRSSRALWGELDWN